MKRQVSFPYYPNIGSLEIGEENLIGVFEPRSTVTDVPAETLIKRAFENPIGSPRISELAAKASNALVIVDDYTRKTPVKEVLSCLIPELNAAGITNENITILIALGTHRPMKEEEMVSKFGAEYCRSLKIINHNWKDTESLADFGQTEEGTRVQVNKAVLESEFVFGIGQIVPHRIAGFSGGGKIIQPGICGPETTAQTHWRSALFNGAEVLGVADNPVRLEIERVAAKAGLAAIANAVCDADGRLIDMFVGDPVAAHRVGAELSRRVYGVKIPEQADILVIDSYPMDIELWQGAKALYAGELAVKQGGIAILISPCPEGVSQTHHLILKEGYRHSWETIARVESGEIDDKIVAAHLVRVGRVIKDNGKGILVSNGISQRDTEKLGFMYAATPQIALDKAFEIMGQDASVTILQRGGTALPVVG